MHKDGKVAVEGKGNDEDLHREFFEYVQRIKGIDEQSYYKLSKQEKFDLNNEDYNVNVIKPRLLARRSSSRMWWLSLFSRDSTRTSSTETVDSTGKRRQDKKSV
jgi:hypothetical protein